MPLVVSGGQKGDQVLVGRDAGECGVLFGPVAKDLVETRDGDGLAELLLQHGQRAVLGGSTARRGHDASSFAPGDKIHVSVETGTRSFPAPDPGPEAGARAVPSFECRPSNGQHGTASG